MKIEDYERTIANTRHGELKDATLTSTYHKVE